ncbi:MAG TPA: TonB-dependent receptor [Vicinamibacterales bacterium]|nr:TonB-dependent receptor [Vicinamibacterales bacterium]
MCRIFSLAGLALLVALPIHAQTTASGSIHGTARDQDGAVLPGVSVSAKSDSVPGRFAATTDGAGQYHLDDLPPGDYTIAAELSGFARFERTAIRVQTGLNVTVDIPMKLGSVEETVEVRQDTPLLETGTGAQSINVSGELLRGIPLTEKREWFGALALAPGVVISDFLTSKLIYVHGADPSGTVIQMDGADVTSANHDGVSYLNLNADTVRDLQIQTSGVDASAPLGIGGVINIATASGTNRLSGAATAFFQPRSWNGSNTPGGTSSTVDQKQFDGSTGGPLLKDHVWGFGSYRYIDITSGLSRTPAQLTTFRALDPGYQPLDAGNKANIWFGKLTAQASAAHQISGFYQRDVNPSDVVSPTLANSFKQASGGVASSVRLSSVWSDRLTTRLNASYNSKHRETFDPNIPGPLMRVDNTVTLSGGRLVGSSILGSIGAPAVSLPVQPNWMATLSADATLYAHQGGGTHELQGGLYVQPRVQGSDTHYINGGFTLEEDVLRIPGDVNSGFIPFHRQILDGTSLTTYKQKTNDYAAYVQDAWRPMPRLTINGGVRVDHIDTRDLLFNVTSQRSTEVGPRLGANYALTADARNVARAHWVLVHDQPGIITTVGSPSLGIRDLYDLNLDGTFETTFVTPPTAGIIANRSNDPDLHQPSVREWGVGYSRQLSGGMAANVDVVHRAFVDRPDLIETNGLYNGDVFAGYKNPAFNEIYVATNNRWNTPVYSSADVSITKRTARVEAVASYVRQWRHMDGTWQPNDPASFIQPDAFANDKGIGSSTGTAAATSDANSLSGTQMTQPVTGSGQWQDHTVRTGLTYVGPWALILSGSYTFQSGTWGGPIVSQLSKSDPAFGPPTVTLSNGRVVSNPLATLVRFAYANRGDGQLHTPALNALNLRAGRRFELGRAKADASLDVFNVTNNGADQGFNVGSNQTYNPQYGTTTFRQLPRSAQVVLRITF